MELAEPRFSEEAGEGDCVPLFVVELPLLVRLLAGLRLRSDWLLGESAMLSTTWNTTSEVRGEWGNE